MTRLIRPLGYIGIVGGLISNQWTLGAAFSPDGQLETSSKVIIAVFQCAAILLGAALVGHRQIERIWDRQGRKKIPFNIAVLLGSSGAWIAAFIWMFKYRGLKGAPYPHPIFPALLGSAEARIVIWVLPIVAACLIAACVFGIFVGWERRSWPYSLAGGMLVTASVGCLWIPGGYANAHSVVFAWTAVWIWWLSSNIRVFLVGLVKVHENLIKLAFDYVVMARVGAFLVWKNQIIGL